MKRDLLIITCGPNALFQDWGSYKDYNFDVALIRWGNHELKNIDDAAHRIDITGHKWQIISKFNDYCNLSDYEYI